jgi:hypothetical protein
MIELGTRILNGDLATDQFIFVWSHTDRSSSNGQSKMEWMDWARISAKAAYRKCAGVCFTVACGR